MKLNLMERWIAALSVSVGTMVPQLDATFIVALTACAIIATTLGEMPQMGNESAHFVVILNITDGITIHSYVDIIYHEFITGRRLNILNHD